MSLLRTVLRIVLALVGIVVVVVVALLVQGHGLLHRSVSNPVPALRVAPESSLLDRGRHLVKVNCSGCHSEGEGGNIVMSGGTYNFFDIPGGPKLGTLYAPNLTPGGVIQGASDGQISRAVREGIGFDGKPLLVMPSAHYHAISDRDLAGLVTYLRSQPAVPGEVPKRKLNLLGYMILGVHQFETSAELPVTVPIATPAETPDSTYGAYLVPILGCSDCHGPDYRGGRKGQFPPIGPNLVHLVSNQPLTTFELALRHGIKPAGGALDPMQMPWHIYANLSDTEVQAVYAFLRGHRAN